MYAEYNQGVFSVRVAETSPEATPQGQYIHVYVAWRGLKNFPQCFKHAKRNYPGSMQDWAQGWSGEVDDLPMVIAELGLPNGGAHVQTMREVLVDDALVMPCYRHARDVYGYEDERDS